MVANARSIRSWNWAQPLSRVTQKLSKIALIIFTEQKDGAAKQLVPSRAVFIPAYCSFSQQSSPNLLQLQMLQQVSVLGLKYRLLSTLPQSCLTLLDQKYQTTAKSSKIRSCHSHFLSLRDCHSENSSSAHVYERAEAGRRSARRALDALPGPKYGASNFVAGRPVLQVDV